MENDNKQILEFDGIGKVVVKRRKGQKSTTLRLSRRGELVLSTNYSTPLYSLKKFVLANKKWLDDVRQKSGLMDHIEIYDGQILGAGIKFKLYLPADVEEAELDFKYKKGSDEIKILNAESDELVSLDLTERKALEKVVVKALRARAKDALPSRLTQIAKLMNANYESLTVRDTSSRWGSCSSKNDINLSLWLMVLPQKLVDYVLVHELAHTRFKHHGSEFWEEVARYIPNHKDLRKELKRHSAQAWW
jgi:predicted metal-dependent hydrolase